jgi:predicted CXXCH cytochrome family protein
MKKSIHLLLIVVACSLPSFGQTDSTETSVDLETYRQVNDFVDENEACFSCHAESKYVLYDEFFDREIPQSMCPDKIVDRDEYYSMVHKSFACLDCHAYEYEEFPHPMEARVEQPYACIDCHGYDENYAAYRFEDIQVEYEASIHHVNNPDNFSCWKCHDPHSYRLFVSNDERTIKEAIAYNNDICLSCHSDFSRFELLTERDEIDIIDKHSWLPNQPAHFGSVRCIECHTALSDSVLVAHQVQPKEMAVKKCAECHSKNSILMASLYKHEAKESRTKLGFINGVILNEAYVIGANRNQFLVVAGIVIFLIALGGIGIHIIARIILKK